MKLSLSLFFDKHTQYVTLNTTTLSSNLKKKINSSFKNKDDSSIHITLTYDEYEQIKNSFITVNVLKNKVDGFLAINVLNPLL